jgi:hypothetical protein
VLLSVDPHKPHYFLTRPSRNLIWLSTRAIRAANRLLSMPG